MNKPRHSRRRLLSRFPVAIAALFSARHAAAAALTPETTEGPFYPTPPMRPADTDNDLVRVSGLVQEAGGEVLHLKGTVSDRSGRPLPGLTIEIWQCDVNGKYLHTGDRRDVEFDNGFQGFGHDISRHDGSYFFRTIKPVSYPGRTPHIHVKVCDGDKELLTTQFYLKDHPDNNRDSLFRRMSPVQAESVSMAIAAGSQGLETSVNIVV